MIGVSNKLKVLGQFCYEPFRVSISSNIPAILYSELLILSEIQSPKLRKKHQWNGIGLEDV